MYKASQFSIVINLEVVNMGGFTVIKWYAKYSKPID